MERFIDEHQARITGTLCCFDRMLFKIHARTMAVKAGRPYIHLNGPARRGTHGPSPNATRLPKGWSASWPR